MSSEIKICSYYFPNWHVDPRNEEMHGKNWTEWRVVEYATPRFPGHEQPKVPLWGYEDEANPSVMAKKIKTATEYGIDAFIFDWYFFQSGHYRKRCLEEGFLQATNCQEIEFALMWANHEPIYSHPGTYKCPSDASLWSGKIDAETFIKCTDYCIENYFGRKNYLRVNDGLYFSIFRLKGLIDDLGGTKVVHELFDDFRNRVEKAGLGKLTLDTKAGGLDPDDFDKANQLITETGIDITSDYGWGLFGRDDFPTLDYSVWAERNRPVPEKFSKGLCVPYNPIVISGWDSSPRTVQSDMHDKCEYPFGTIITGSSPETYEKSLRRTMQFMKTEDATGNMLYVGCWNEWTEGFYLEPDEKYGYGYLQAVKNVVGNKSDCHE